ncbi:MAG: TspO/MBR family protein [Candidatus Caenarcaniphilales bacterium]|nr:TspO/MBR family protein [Candidatus Caenarcaniphilales bacterium]
MKNKVLSLIGFVFVCQLAGLIGGLITSNSVDTWYSTLIRPSLTPPNWIFGPVWTILYALLGVSSWIIFQSESSWKKRALTAFFINILINVIWSFLFFGLQSTLLGFIWIIVLELSIIWVLVEFWRVSKLASFLMLPYFLWVSFASFVAFNIWWLNK